MKSKVEREVHAKDMTLTSKIGKDKSDFIVKLKTKISEDLDGRANWDAKMIMAMNQRLGVKRYSNYPYEGAPDVPLPETDKLIKKAIPNLVLSAWQVKKMCLIDVQDGVKWTEELGAKARRAEERMNSHLRSKRVDFFRKLMLLADNYKTYGFAIARVYEEFIARNVTKVIDINEYDEEMVKALKSLNKSEKVAFLSDRFSLDPEDEVDRESIEQAIAQFTSGNDIIEFDVMEYENFPNIEVISPTKIIVPAYSTSIRQLPRLTWEYFLTREVLQERINQGIYKDIDLDKIEPTVSDDDMIEVQKSYNEGISENKTKGDIYRIHETLCYYPEKKNKYQRWAFTHFADITDPEESVLQDMAFPYEFAGWNYVKIDNEIKDPRFYNSRGTPEQIRALQEVLERSVNNALIRDELNNIPMWEVLGSSKLLSSQIQLRPGMKLPVKALGQEIAQLNRQNSPDVSSNMIMQVVKAYAEEYVGSVDQLFRNASNVGGGKTLGEVQQGIQVASGLTMLDVINFNNGLSEVYEMMFNIFKERVTDSVFVGEQEITREDFNFQAEVRSNGNLEVVDKEMATQKAQMRLNVLTSPIMQDCVTPEDKYNGVKDWLEKDGVKDPDMFCTDPKEVLTDQLTQLKQQIAQLQKEAQDMTKANESLKHNAGKSKKELDAIEEMTDQEASSYLQMGLKKMGNGPDIEQAVGGMAGGGQ